MRKPSGGSSPVEKPPEGLTSPVSRFPVLLLLDEDEILRPAPERVRIGDLQRALYHPLLRVLRLGVVHVLSGDDAVRLARIREADREVLELRDRLELRRLEVTSGDDRLASSEQQLGAALLLDQPAVHELLLGADRDEHRVFTRRHLGRAGNEHRVRARQAVDALRERNDLGLLTLDRRLHLLNRLLVLGELGDLLRIDLRMRQLVVPQLPDTRFARVEPRDQHADLRLDRLELARGVRFGLGRVARRRLLAGLEPNVREILVDVVDETRAGRGVADDGTLLAELAGLVGNDAILCLQQRVLRSIAESGASVGVATGLLLTRDRRRGESESDEASVHSGLQVVLDWACRIRSIEATRLALRAGS